MATITRMEIVTALRAAGFPAELVTLGGNVLGVSAYGASTGAQDVIVTIDQGAGSYGTVGLSSLEITCAYPPDEARPDDAPFWDAILPTASEIVTRVRDMARVLGLT